jgi:hypothetical protein
MPDLRSLNPDGFWHPSQLCYHAKSLLAVDRKKLNYSKNNEEEKSL